MADDKSKLPGSSFDELSKIIQAYSTFENKVELKGVAKVAAMHETSISRNVGFLVSLGLLEPGAKKMPTPLGKALGRALTHNMEEEARKHWRAAITSNEFLANIIAAVRIRNGMEPSVLQSHIAYSAGVGKSANTSTGTAAVIDLLRYAGLLREQDGKLLAAAAPTFYDHPVDQPIDSEQSLVALPQPLHEPPSASLHLEVHINCSASDIDGLGLKLRKLLKELREHPEPPTPEEE